jgi:hypothetical protein
MEIDAYKGNCVMIFSSHRNRHKDVIIFLRNLLKLRIVRHTLGAEFSPYDIIHDISRAVDFSQSMSIL